MHAVMLGVTLGLVGLDVGWRPLPGGGVEYILQIAPNELELFKSDKEIACDVQPHLRDVRSLRVLLGNYILPRQDPPQSPPPSAPSPKQASAGWGGSADPLRDFLIRATTRLWDPARLRPLARPSEVALSKEPSKKAKEAPTGPGTLPTPHTAEVASDRKPQPQSQPDKKLPATQPPILPTKPWMPFTVAVVAFFGSFGGNLYLLWILRETRARYRALLHRHLRSRHRREEARDQLAAYDS